MSTKLTIERQNGNVPKSLSGQDHISGLIAYLLTTDIPTPFVNSPIQAISTIDAAEALGILSDAPKWSIKMLHYQIYEIFRINSGITLYVGLFAKPTTLTFVEIKTVQNFANGSIRQIGVWNGDTEPTAENVAKINGVADALDAENAPLSVLYAPKVSDYTKLPANLAVSSPRVSVIIAQDGGGTGADLYSSAENTSKASVSAIGVAIGTLSKASVHQSIAWIKNFPSGISMPAFGDGKLIRNVDKAVLESLDTQRYLFLTSVVGISGSYWNDSHTLDVATSDFSMIESVRTMDKAVRGIRTYLTPELGGNVYIDPDTGMMQPYTVSHLETTANKALEDMEKAGELSGYEAKIDPNQDVLSTSTVEVIIKNVAVGVVRKMKVKIGYVKQLS